MAFNQLNGKQIRNLVLANNHVSETAAIAESKLAVDWNAHYQAALQYKKLLDYVQLNNIVVGATAGSVDIALGGGAGEISLASAIGGAGDAKGVVDVQPVLIRDSATGQPIELSGHEIYGEISFAADVYTIAFMANEVAVDLIGEFPEVANIDIQYPARFDLYEIAESFAMNEKFVDGAADVTEIQNLRQLAKDLYGGAWNLDNDGDANGIASDGETISLKAHLDRIHGSDAITGSISYEIKTQVIDPLATTAGAGTIGILDSGELYDAATVEAALAEVMAELNSEISRAGGAESGLAQDISDEASARSDADTLIINNLASTVAELGASLIGIEAVSGLSGTVQDAIENIDSRLDSLESGGGAEVTNTHSRESNYVNNLFQVADYTALEDRLIDIETVLDAEVSNRKDDVDAEQLRAETVESNLQDEIDAIELASGLETDGTYVQHTTSNYINDATNLKAADVLLDAQAKANADAIDAVEDDVASIVALSGVAVDAEDLGVFTGVTIADGQTIKAALQAIESAFEETDANVDSLITLSGVAENDVNLGVFAGSTIAANLTVKGAIESLETAHELLITDLATQATAGKGSDLIGIQALANRTAVALTVQGGLDILDSDLDAIEDWKATVVNKIHVHNDESHSPADAATEVTTTADLVNGTDFLAIYVNGMRQLPTTHFTTAQGIGGDAAKIVITFLDAFVTGDNVYIEYMKYD